MGYVKPKKAKIRLERRQKAYDSTITKDPHLARSMTRPGSLKKSE